MLETMKYVRKPFYIDAVQITALNLENVAKWVDGDVRTDDQGQYVKVRVHRPITDRQTKAYPGDWVLYAGTGYKVYTPKAFANSFEQHSTAITLQNVDEKVSEDTEIIGVVEDKLVVPKKVPKKAVARPLMGSVSDPFKA